VGDDKSPEKERQQCFSALAGLDDQVERVEIKYLDYVYIRNTRYGNFARVKVEDSSIMDAVPGK
jgi:hypothetical protein